MADNKPRLLDVWVREINQVYREVPYAVVTDWLQQGRLLAEDCVRRTGSQKWHAIAAVPALAPYVPRAEPHRAEDQAEAHEPVEMGLDFRRPGEEEDDDVDMIPLIDISLVLLIFFMMTATVGSDVLSAITTPSAQHQLAEITRGTYWVGIDTKSHAGTVEKGENGQPLPWFSLGKDNAEQVKPAREFAAVTEGLARDLKEAPAGEVRIRLRAERSLPIETIKAVTVQLQELESRLNRSRAAQAKLTFLIQGEVSEPKNK